MKLNDGTRGGVEFWNIVVAHQGGSQVHSYLFLNFKPGSHMPPTYLRFICRLQRTMFSDLFSGLPAHLCWIAVVLKLARNANQIGAIFISNMDRIVLLKCPFLLTLVLMMRYIRRKISWRRWELKECIGCSQCFKGEKNHRSSIILCSPSWDILACNTFLCHFECQELWEKLSCKLYIVLQISADNVHINYFHRRQGPVCLQSWTQLNFAGKPAINAWDRQCVGDKCSHMLQHYPRPWPRFCCR